LRVLLDTHIWIWRLVEPERVAKPVAAVLADPSSELYLSPISVWEALVLARKGRIELHPDPAAWVRIALRKAALRPAPFDHRVALQSEDLPRFESQDPADRFLVATALVHRFTLATADRAMRRWEPVETL
jgi:PIN domain nuclease of toxin-antitoxin system